MLKQPPTWRRWLKSRSDRRRIPAFLTAGALSAVGVGLALTWSATATESHTAREIQTDSGEIGISIDLDSLYAAKAAEKPSFDSSFAIAVEPRQTIKGKVSWYGPRFHGRKTASGERFNRNEMTAAHKTLPFGTLVRVINQNTEKSLLVRINDRGPYCGGRVLDLAEGAASRLGIKGSGTGSVRIEIFPTEKESPADIRAFDTDGRLVTLHGYSVLVASMMDFDEAIDLQHRLHGEGHGDVFLAERRHGSTKTYQVYIGLFSSQVSSESLLADISDIYSTATTVRFDDGRATSLKFAALPEGDSARM